MPVFFSALRHWLSFGLSIGLAQVGEGFEGEFMSFPAGFLSRVEPCVWCVEDPKDLWGLGRGEWKEGWNLLDEGKWWGVG